MLSNSQRHIDSPEEHSHTGFLAHACKIVQFQAGKFIFITCYSCSLYDIMETSHLVRVWLQNRFTVRNMSEIYYDGNCWYFGL